MSENVRRLAPTEPSGIMDAQQADSYVEAYETILQALRKRDYPAEVRMRIAAVLAAEWVGAVEQR